jgi:hypothetical protein
MFKLLIRYTEVNVIMDVYRSLTGIRICTDLQISNDVSIDLPY